MITFIGSVAAKSTYGIFEKAPAIYGILSFCSFPIAIITLIITQLQFCNLIGLEFKWFFILVIIPYLIGDFIPYGGTLKIICAIILGMIVGLKLAEVYNKEGKFKVGLCGLPAVFIPILGFTEE